MVYLAGNAQFAELRGYIAAELEANPSYAAEYNPFSYDIIIEAAQWAFAGAYRYVYLISIPFGVISIVASLFLGDIKKYLDDHVAVVYNH